MKRKPVKLSFRLSEKEADMVVFLANHCRTWDPSKTLRFALKVLGQVVRDDIRADDYPLLATDFSATKLVDDLRLKCEQLGAKKSRSDMPIGVSDVASAEKKVGPKRSGTKRPTKTPA